MIEFTSFFKYCSDDPKVIKGIFKGQKIRFTQPWALNDPLEFNPTIKFGNQEVLHDYYEIEGIVFPSIELFYRVQIIESQINKHGILSLTNTPFSFDMWSKYANGHKGFVLELKPNFVEYLNLRANQSDENLVRKVEYVDDYILEIEDLVDNTGIIKLEILQKELFFKKTSRWKDEQEYRLVRSLSDSVSYKPPKANLSYRDDEIYLFDFPLQGINSVVFGVHMSIRNKRLIMKHCDGCEIKFYQSYIIRDEKDDFNKPSKIGIIAVSNLESVDELYRFKPQALSVDKERLGDISKTIKLVSLTDLPYYDGHEEIIQEFVNNARNQVRRKDN